MPVGRSYFNRYGSIASNATTIGSTKNNFGKKIRNQFSSFSNILFLQWINDNLTLDTLRHFSRLYIHGHSVGGTNPSLLEAMAAESLIVAHNNEFNKAVLSEDALYFDSTEKLKTIISKTDFTFRNNYVAANKIKIEFEYNWRIVTDSYEIFLNNLIV